MTKPVINGNSSQRSLSLSPHPDYYIRGGDLFFLCGRLLFKVHSHFFLRESCFWRKELTAPASPGGSPPKGTSDSSAIILDEKPEDFEQLLWVFYNTEYGNYTRATIDNWMTILNYSTKWDFPRVKELAIKYLESRDMDPIQRINLYQANKLPEKYLFRLYMQVACRPDLLSIEESRTLNLETLVLIHQARERLRVQPSADKPHLSPIRTDLGHADVIGIVAQTFNISLTEVPEQKPDSNSGSAVTPKGTSEGGSSKTGKKGASKKKEKEKEKEREKEKEKEIEKEKETENENEKKTENEKEKEKEKENSGGSGFKWNLTQWP